MANIRIIDLPTQTEVDESVYIPVESRTKGTKKYPIGEVLEDVNDAVDRVEAAIDAVDDISSQAIPLMSNDIRGGAKLEANGGLRLVNDGLGLVESTQESDGEVSGSLVEVTANGHAEQFSTTGKNLLPSLVGSSVQNEITATLNADGSITLNGTATGGISLKGGHINLGAGTYTLSSGISLPSGVWVSVSNAQPMITPGNTSKTATVDAFSDAYLLIYINSGISFSNVRIYPQLELGSTATAYEPYTGGAPSPSPDYPQEIQVVRGRNLWDESRDIPNKVLIADGSDTAHSAYSHSDYIKVEPNTDYYVTNTTGATSMRTACVYDSSKTFLRIANLSGTGIVSGALNTGAGAAYIRINYPVESSNHQLTLGSTPQPYVPYGHVGMDLEVTLTLYKDGYAILANGVESANASFKIMSIRASYDSCVLSVSQEAGNTSRLHAYDSFGKWLAQVTSLAGPASTVVSIPAGTSELRLSTPKNATFSITSTTPIPLPSRGWVAGLPDGTADTLTLDGAGKVEWTIRDDEVVLDGSDDEGWLLSGGGGYRVISGVIANKMLRPQSNAIAAILLTSHFVSRTANQTYGGTIGLSFDNGGGVGIARTGAATTVADETAWLSTHPITILYPLATPVIESLGYIDMPSIPSDATITIPELDALNVKYMVRNTAAKEYAEAWEKKLIRTNPTGGLKHTNEGFAIDTLVHDSMNDIISGGIAELTAKGHAEQFSTTGKNLSTVNTIDNVGWATESDSLKGILNQLSAGTYTISFTVTIKAITSTDGTNGYGIRIDNSSSGNVQNILSWGSQAPSVWDSANCSLSITIDNASVGNFTHVYLYVRQNATGILSNIQLELGSTATAYEPYTGGAPSPSPDYPQEIQVVRGRNLLDTIEQGGFNVSGMNSGTAANRTRSTHYMSVLAGSSYVVSGSGASGKTLQASISWYAVDDYATARLSYTEFASLPCLISAPTGAAFARMTLRNSDDSNISPSDVSHVQLEFGSTPTPYVPYGHVGLEVHGKNLYHETMYDVGNARSTVGISVTKVGLTEYRAVGTATANAWFYGSSSAISDEYYVVLPAGRYTASTNAPRITVRKRVDGANVAIGSSDNGIYTFTIDEPTPVLAVPVIPSGMTASGDVYWIQLEAGSTATPYQPYFHTTTPIPLPSRGWVAGLPDGTADTLTLDGAGKVTWEKGTDELTFDGSDMTGWNVQGNNKTTGGGFYTYTIETGSTVSSQKCLVNNLSYIGGMIMSNNYVGSVGFGQTLGAFRVRPIETTSEQTLSDFGTWLSTHPVTVLYPLATPVTEDCGYVNMPAIPSDATVTIPELDALGIRYFVDDTVTQYGREIIARVRSEYEDRIAALEQAVAELATS